MAGQELLDVPLQALDAAFAERLAAALTAAATRPAADLPAVLPQAAALSLLRRCAKGVKAEPTLLRFSPPPGPAAEVVVVGDLHGQFHDLLTIFSKAGTPSDSRCFIFDGDFVDRGAWSLETLLLLCAWKLALPKHVLLLRGNHESTYCAWVYGFRREVLAKYGGGPEGEAVFTACQVLFSQLPLAAVVAGATLVVHGGLARQPPRRATRRSLPAEVTIASLADMASSSKGGEDPDPANPEQRLAADLLWSDPGSEPGIQLGARPGDVGVRFGPDVTEAFLRDNGLRCILRGHEGPDARVLRPDMQPMSSGWTLDHDTPAGRLYTVFSAPCYPQFGDSYQNLGAVAVLGPPTFDAPRFVQYEAAPRPQATPFFLDSEDAKAAAADADAADALEEEGAAVEPGGSSDEGGSEGSSGAGSEDEGPAIAGSRGGGGAAGDTAEGSAEQAAGRSEHAAAVEAAAAGGRGGEGAVAAGPGGQRAAGQEAGSSAPGASVLAAPAEPVAAAQQGGGSSEPEEQAGQQPAIKRMKLAPSPLPVPVEAGAGDG